MPLNYPQAGPSDVASYQLSAVPFVTTSAGSEVGTTAIRVKFPSATRFFIVKETAGNDLRIGFTDNGVSAKGGVTGSNQVNGEDVNPAERKNYFILSSGSTTPRLEIRCKELYFRRDGAVNSGFSIFAGLSPINHRQFPVLTGSSEYDGVG